MKSLALITILTISTIITCYLKLFYVRNDSTSNCSNDIAHLTLFLFISIEDWMLFELLLYKIWLNIWNICSFRNCFYFFGTEEMRRHSRWMISAIKKQKNIRDLSGILIICHYLWLADTNFNFLLMNIQFSIWKIINYYLKDKNACI